MGFRSPKPLRDQSEALAEAEGRTPSDALIEAMHDWGIRERVSVEPLVTRGNHLTPSTSPEAKPAWPNLALVRPAAFGSTDRSSSHRT
jgi:hypothetical protein